MLIVHLFVSYAHVNLCHFFSSSWCRGLAAASACGSSWTFLLTLFIVMLSDRIVVSNKTFMQFERLNRLSEHLHETD